MPPDRLLLGCLAVDFFDDERLAVDFLRDVDFLDPPEELERFEDDFFEEDDVFEEDDFFEPPPDALPPRLGAPGEFAIFAARSFDMPLSRSPSYCLRFLTLPPWFPSMGITSEPTRTHPTNIDATATMPIAPASARVQAAA